MITEALTSGAWIQSQILWFQTTNFKTLTRYSTAFFLDKKSEIWILNTHITTYQNTRSSHRVYHLLLLCTYFWPHHQKVSRKSLALLIPLFLCLFVISEHLILIWLWMVVYRREGIRVEFCWIKWTGLNSLYSEVTIFLLFFILAVLHGLHDLSSLTGGWI